MVYVVVVVALQLYVACKIVECDLKIKRGADSWVTELQISADSYLDYGNSLAFAVIYIAKRNR